MVSPDKTLGDWREIVARKREEQKLAIPQAWVIRQEHLPSPDQRNISAFPEECGLLTEREVLITTLIGREEDQGRNGVEALLRNISGRTWTSVEVVTAFAKRAIIAHQLVKCLTEILIEDALKQAAVLDAHLESTGKVIGPLHGLPVSLKDQINVQGVDSTMGYVSWIGQPADSNAVIVDVLTSLGAIPFVKTNVPQTLMWGETFNHIFGRTVNPYNRRLTSGGSSGGEGALIGMKGSPLGIGSDVGGSIRIPSAFCGIYGLRPSYHRLPYSGCRNSLEGQDAIPSVLGPMAPSLSVIKLLVQSILEAKPWLKDPLVIRKPWSQDEYQLSEHGNGQEKLCFGIVRHDGIVMPHPPVQRALAEAASALAAAGHKVVDWIPIKHKELTQTALDIWRSGSAEDYKAVCAIAGEPLISSMSIAEENSAFLRLPDVPLSQESLASGRDTVSAYHLWQLHKRRRELREEYHHWWQTSEEWAQTGTGRPVDALICPVGCYAAPPHGTIASNNYTIIWNVLDYPALAIPVTRVAAAVDVHVARHDSEFLTDTDKEIHAHYNPATYDGAPVGLQVVARTMEEESLIAMSEVVDRALRTRKSIISV